jgi:vancomycin permeability regulator SanA
MDEGKTVEVQSVHQAQVESTNPAFGENRTLYAIIAYHFQQYKLEEIEDMPYRDVALLLKTAQKIEAERMYNLTMIASAPQSKNGKGVKTLLEHFRKLLKG